MKSKMKRLLLLLVPLLLIGAASINNTNTVSNLQVLTNVVTPSITLNGTTRTTWPVGSTNWSDSGTTNSVLPGNATAYGLNMTSGYIKTTNALGFTFDGPALSSYNAWDGVVDFYFATSAGNTNQVRKLRVGPGSIVASTQLIVAGDLTFSGPEVWSIGGVSSTRPQFVNVAESVRAPSVQFGGTTSSKAKIIDNGTTLKVQLADGSADAAMISYGATMTEGKIATVTGIDLNVTTKSTLYTVPTGKTLIVTKVTVRNASSSLTTASFGIGYNAGADDVIASATHTALTGSTLYEVIPAKVGAVKGSAADVLGLKCSIAQGGAATVDVDVWGFFL